MLLCLIPPGNNLTVTLWIGPHSLTDKFPGVMLDSKMDLKAKYTLIDLSFQQ